MVATEIDERRPRGRPRSFDRAAALDRALTLFWERGYEGTSIADLTAAMAITPPSLYAAFGSKQQLYREALERYLARSNVCAMLTEASTARGAIAQLLHGAAASFTAGVEPPGCMVWTGVLSCAPEHQGVADLVAGLRRQSIDLLAQRIDRGIAAGELAADTDAVGLAGFYGAIIQGMSSQARDGADRAALTAIAEAALRAWPAAPRNAPRARVTRSQPSRR